MEHSFLDLLGRSLVRGWLTHSQHSWRRLPVAHDSPHVHAPGANPDRILLTGDGASAGVGVLTHELGLPGYLARRVSALTGRATDVDILVSTDMTVRKCAAALVDCRLNRYDVIILSLGVNESLNFDSVDRWRIELIGILDFIKRESTASTKSIVLSIPYCSSRSEFPRLLARLVDRRARRMNDMAEAIIDRMDRVHFVEFAPGDELESDGAHAYDQWARGIAPTVSKLLAPSWSTSIRAPRPR
ncbi:MAG: SGNH/GDSL hydrolase family protein [Pseudolysinimonas sp.]